MNAIEQKYNHISDLYIHFINTEEYAKHPLVNHVDKKTTQHLKKAFNFLKSGDYVAAEDVLTTASTDCEEVGFILGFSYAFNLLKETDVLKELMK